MFLIYEIEVLFSPYLTISNYLIWILLNEALCWIFRFYLKAFSALKRTATTVLHLIKIKLPLTKVSLTSMKTQHNLWKFWIQFPKFSSPIKILISNFSSIKDQQYNCNNRLSWLNIYYINVSSLVKRFL